MIQETQYCNWTIYWMSVIHQTSTRFLQKQTREAGWFERTVKKVKSEELTPCSLGLHWPPAAANRNPSFRMNPTWSQIPLSEIADLLSFLSFGAEYLLGSESANCSTELLETNLTSGGWQQAPRNQQSGEDWWSILMLQLHCFLPWVPCSAAGWEGQGVKGTSLAWTASRRQLIAGGSCLSPPGNWKEIVIQILQRSGAGIAALTSVLWSCLAYWYVCCLR